MHKLLVCSLIFFSLNTFAQTITQKKAKPAAKAAPVKAEVSQPKAVKAVAEPVETFEKPKPAEKKGAFLLDPYVGIDLATIDATCSGAGIACSTAGSYSFSANGLALGTRGAYLTESGWYFGGDFQATLGGQFQVNSKPAAATTQNQNFYKIMLGMLAGWQPNNSFDFWAEYFLLNDMTLQFSSGNQIYHGDGFRFGAGWAISDHFKVNGSLDVLTFKQIEFNGASQAAGTSWSKFSDLVFHLNCSFPFQF